MRRSPSIDQGRSFDWGKTSGDYAAHRPGPPPGFYDRLALLGVGGPGRRILDLGTGTGLLAREFARRGAKVSGIDVAPGQIETARRLAAAEGLRADFKVAPAEAIPFPDACFDAVSANQCWLYFDKRRAIPEVIRVLKPGGLLAVSHFSYLARRSEIARRSERLVLRSNPDWTAADDPCDVPPMPSWAKLRFDLRAMFWYDEPVRFTRASWAGRMRACRGVGAELSPEELRRFDAEHRKLLARIAPPAFGVLHRVDAHILEPKGPSGP